MKEFLFHLHFTAPLFLFLLFFLPLLWLRLRQRSFAVILWRSLIFLLLILSLADPVRIDEFRFDKVQRKAERIVAFDLSKSIPGTMRRWMERSAREIIRIGATDRTFVFGGKVKEVTDWNRWVGGETSVKPVTPGQTNLENLFSTLLNLPRMPRNVFLFTDGWETRGGVDRLLPSLGLSGLKVFPLLPPDGPRAANVVVRKVLAPNQGTKGEGITMNVVLENQNPREVDGRLTLRRNGQPFQTDVLKLKPGSHIFRYKATLPKGPLVSFSAGFVSRTPKSDAFLLDNQATSWVAVQVKEKVILFNGRREEGRYLDAVLQRLGFEVTSVVPQVPFPSLAGYGVVIFNNVKRGAFSREYLTRIEQHVAQGNGFLMLGGEGSFGPGGYRKTPIEHLLPVKIKEPRKKEKNRAVILVIDKSGSMREADKLLYAKEAAKAVARQLKNRDLLGVVGFDVSPFVVVPLASMGKIRMTVASQINRLKAGGKTYLYPAILEAKRQLERQRADQKHVIILSDGETGGSGGDYIDLAAVMKGELKIILSTVAIGDRANIPLLKRIARYGGGVFHHTYDPTSLPRIVLQQIREKPQRKLMVEKTFKPVLVRGSRLLAGFPQRTYPSLEGFIKTEIKRGAHLDLAIPRREKTSPLLASWDYGRGKAAAFTTDLHGRWTQRWIQWKPLQPFLGKVFEWLRPPKASLPAHEIRINLAGDRPVLDLYLYEEKSGGSLFRYSLRGRGVKQEGILERLAAGHFQTRLPLSRPGDYHIGLTEERVGQKLSYPAVGYTLPFDPRTEIPRGDFNVSLLERLAQSTSGTINPEPEAQATTHEVRRSSKSFRSYLILLTALLFLFEIFFRRLFLPTAFI
ncbi:MAG: VWA domain-containing protein [Candidatus Binatia bacterium]